MPSSIVKTLWIFAGILASTPLIVLPLACGYSGTPADPSTGDWDGDGFTGAQGDCNNTDATFYPGAPDTVGDGIDENCDLTDGVDADGDGHADIPSGGDDCDDAARDTHPGAFDAWYDGIDEDCAGNDDYDKDGDGVDSSDYGGEDCNDNNPAIPGPEVWDNIDNNCDGFVDEITATFTYQDDGNGGSVMVVTLQNSDPGGESMGLAETSQGGAGWYGEDCMTRHGSCHLLGAAGGEYTVVDNTADVRMGSTTYFSEARLAGSAVVFWDTHNNCTAIGSGADYYAAEGCDIEEGW